MSKYLRKFETSAAYDAAKDTLDKPNVSYIVETNGVAFNPIIIYEDFGNITLKIGVMTDNDGWGDDLLISTINKGTVNAPFPQEGNYTLDICRYNGFFLYGVEVSTLSTPPSNINVSCIIKQYGETETVNLTRSGNKFEYDMSNDPDNAVSIINTTGAEITLKTSDNVVIGSFKLITYYPVYDCMG